MTGTTELFQRIIEALVAMGVTDSIKSAHWPIPESDETLYRALIDEGVSAVNIAEAFSKLTNKPIYSGEAGDFDHEGDDWGIANNTLYIVNPYGHTMEEMLEERAKGKVNFDKTGILIGSSTITLTQAASKTELDKSINEMIESALEMGASDIHVSPRTRKHLSIQFRSDGVIKPYQHNVTMDEYQDWSNKLLGRAGKIGGKPTKPMDLKFNYHWKDKDIQVRLAASPVMSGGEPFFYFVMRLLNPTGQQRQLKDIGFPKVEYETLKTLCRSPKGLVIVTGPTGSGKTTTLYALLQLIQELRPGDSIQTLEDPVEVELPGIHQTQINVQAGMTFAEGLRTKLRQDPDVILVGELRDLETTNLAIEASMTGHLVLATMHTNSAVQTISRLTNMGVNPSTLADSLLAVSAQRMVRNVCPVCSTEEEFGENKGIAEKYSSLRGAPQLGEPIKVANHSGCSKCDAGYTGRSLVSELMIIDPWTQNQILEGTSANVIEEKHRNHQYSTMWDNGISMVRRGKTTISELEARLSPLASYGQHFTYGRETNLL